MHAQCDSEALYWEQFFSCSSPGCEPLTVLLYFTPYLFQCTAESTFVCLSIHHLYPCMPVSVSSMCWSIHPHIHSSLIYSSICVPIYHPSVRPLTYSPIYPCVYLFIPTYIHTYTYPHIHPSVKAAFICLSNCHLQDLLPVC